MWILGLKGLKIGIQFLEYEESVAWNPKSKTVLDSLTWGDYILVKSN